MTRLDDHDLIEGLQSGLAERQAEVSAPGTIADRARRAAHRQTATRVLAAGVPALAAAGVATALTASGLGASHPGAAAAHDTAYVLKHVEARLAQDDASDYVVYSRGYASGQVNADGSVSDLAAEGNRIWDYLAPDGIHYFDEQATNADGSLSGEVEYWWVYPVVKDSEQYAMTLIDNNAHTYSQAGDVRYGIPANAPTDAGQPVVGLGSSAPEVQQAIQSGELTEKGTTTVDGTSVIALTTQMNSSTPQASSYDLTLYVDAQSYQPVQLVQQVQGSPAVDIQDYEPATAANVALAEQSSIPTGYTKVTSPPVLPDGQ